MVTVTVYETLRKRGMTATQAMRWARARLAVRQEAARLGLIWWKDRFGPSWASWKQAGFTLNATIEVFPEGWAEMGQAVYGVFSTKRAPNAIRVTDRLARRRFGAWFIPADPDRAREALKRACRYRLDWRYVGLIVQAFRNGALYGEAALFGLESDTEEDELTDVALDLAAEAIDIARRKRADALDDPASSLPADDSAGNADGA